MKFAQVTMITIVKIRNYTIASETKTIKKTRIIFKVSFVKLFSGSN